jgi:hypothetical protein
MVSRWVMKNFFRYLSTRRVLDIREEKVLSQQTSTQSVPVQLAGFQEFSASQTEEVSRRSTSGRHRSRTMYSYLRAPPKAEEFIIKDNSLRC